MSRESKLNQVRNLLNKTLENGATAEEMNAAFLTAQRIMSNWAISEIEINASEIPADEEIIQGKSNLKVKGSQWILDIATTIARNFRVIRWRTRAETEKIRNKRVRQNDEWVTVQYTEKSTKNSQQFVYTFFGEKSDSQIASFLFDQAVHAALALGTETYQEDIFTKTTKHQYVMNYCEAFAKGLNDAFEEQVRNDGTGSTSLMVIRKVPARVHAAMPFRLVHANSSRARTSDSNARTAGYQDGKAFGGAQKQTRGGKNNVRGYIN